MTRLCSLCPAVLDALRFIQDDTIEFSFRRMKEWELDGQILVVEINVAILIVLHVLVESFEFASNGAVRGQNHIVSEELVCGRLTAVIYEYG